jgi:methylated-DNA-[protein]-cysteine S-methyltransferase
MLAVFPTPLGWFGLVGGEGRVHRILLGHACADDVRTAAVAEAGRSEPFRESDWHPELRRRLERYAQGAVVDFDDIALALPPMTDFQHRVVAETRALRYGSTASYGELAERVGAPRAARAVGTVMSSNTMPLLIPCHRVVAAGGRLGGYSAPQGLTLKQRLLAMEASPRHD